MRLIIAGSRDLIPTVGFISSSLGLYNIGPISITEVVCGAAQGVDTMGKIWAETYNKEIKIFKADWDKHGKAAGPIRNLEMAQYADGLLVIHNGSRGAMNMKLEMMRLGKPVYEVQLWTNQK